MHSKPLSGDACRPPAARNVRSYWLRDPFERCDPGPRQIRRPRRSSTAGVQFGAQPRRRRACPQARAHIDLAQGIDAVSVGKLLANIDDRNLWAELTLYGISFPPA